MVEVTPGGTPDDRVYVGWRFARIHDDPGPPPRRPKPPDTERLNPDWINAQRRDENLLNRPLKITAGGTGVGGLIFVAAWVSGALPGMFSIVGLIACVFILMITGYAIWQGEQAVRSRIDEEERRLERIDADRVHKLNHAHERHRQAYERWQRRQQAYSGQKEWYAVTVPSGVDRVDVAGGTLSGWSAMVTMMGAARLATPGATVSVVDLTEGAVAQELVELARGQGDDPLVWVLPSDLPRLHLNSGLDTEALSDVLSLVVSVSEDHDRDLSFDNAILERIVSVFGPAATIPQITAALRALAQVGDPREDIQLGLITDDQLRRVTTMFGRAAADRVVVERAWALESQLRKLEALGSEPVQLPPGRLRVVSTDRRAGVLTNKVLGTYVVTALTHVLRASPTDRPWTHTMVLCGAEKLRGDVLDRLIDACESSSTGLVLMYRSITPTVKERLGRGHAAVGFMRLGNAEDAQAAAQHIGTSARLVVAGLTDAVGETVPGLPGKPYTSTVKATGSPPPAASDADTDPGPGDGEEATARHWSDVLTDGIARSTTWAENTSAASPDGEGTRELLVEPHELQQLPTTAMIFTHASADGRQIVLLDANPGISTLPTASPAEYAEAISAQEEDDDAGADAPPADADDAGAAPVGKMAGTRSRTSGDAPSHRESQALGGNGAAADQPLADEPASSVSSGAEEPPPNLGPPPERLDFRRRRGR